jgi:superfamily II DNA or RNA helicase
MELKEIRKVVEEILSDINKNQNDLTYRKYDTFFERIGMAYKRKFDILDKFDYQFKKRNITLWAGKRPVKKLEDFRKNETITFRLIPTKDTDGGDEKNEKVPVEYAGTVTVAQSESGLKLYDHQKDAFHNLQEEIIKSNKNPFAGLLVLPTGGGKTLTAAHWVAKNILDNNKKVLWIAHRHELLEQAQKTFAEKLAFKDIFTNKPSFNYRILSGIHDKPVNIKRTDDIIISSKDSLNAGFDYLYKNWIKNNIDEIFLVVDEAHHATAKTYRRLIANLKDNVSQFRMLGLTATPFRTAEGEEGLLKKVFPDDIVYKTDLRDLIRLGILSEPHFEEIKTEYDVIKKHGLTEDQIDELKLKFKDLTAILGETIIHTIATNRERNLAIVSRYISQKSKYKQTIVFALNVDNAIALNALFSKAGVKSDYVVSSIRDAATGVTISNEENKEKIKKFRAGEIDVLINVNILTEGTDVPNVQSIFLTRPTISSILMTQMIGRGLRGPKAGGTKDAYIVSFVDEWQNKISWVNPEKLFIENNVDFEDKDYETQKRIIRFVSIHKIEEFAILNDQLIDPKVRAELERLAFINRFPIGIYFNEAEDSEEINCGVLVYDNVYQAYNDFINSLPELFLEHGLDKRDSLTDDELKHYAKIVEENFFDGCLKYPAYYTQDIKDILQYYAIKDQIPPFVKLEDREKYDIDKIAKEIVDQNMGERDQAEMLNRIWESTEVAWQVFFNYDKRNFLREIDSAISRYLHPDLFKINPVIPIDEKELKRLEELSLYEIRKSNLGYWRQLTNAVYEKFQDKDGFYFSAKSGFKSKAKIVFQIDHIEPMSQGGLTVLDNLQLLTRRENGEKGSNGRY